MKTLKLLTARYTSFGRKICRTVDFNYSMLLVFRICEYNRNIGKMQSCRFMGTPSPEKDLAIGKVGHIYMYTHRKYIVRKCHSSEILYRESKAEKSRVVVGKIDIPKMHYS